MQNMQNLQNQTYQMKATKPNLPSQTYQTKPTEPNLANQAYWTKPSQTLPTKSNQNYWLKQSTPGCVVPLAMLCFLFGWNDIYFFSIWRTILYLVKWLEVKSCDGTKVLPTIYHTILNALEEVPRPERAHKRISLPYSHWNDQSTDTRGQTKQKIFKI